MAGEGQERPAHKHNFILVAPKGFRYSTLLLLSYCPPSPPGCFGSFITNFFTCSLLNTPAILHPSRGAQTKVFLHFWECKHLSLSGQRLGEHLHPTARLSRLTSGGRKGIKEIYHHNDFMTPEPYSSESPKVAGARGETIERREGSGFALPCRAQGFPVPEFRLVLCSIVNDG